MVWLGAAACLGCGGCCAEPIAVAKSVLTSTGAVLAQHQAGSACMPPTMLCAKFGSVPGRFQSECAAGCR
jgi:hypothetical protein